jgi:Histidine kinase-, DNA gyrase B-, and HSP90-like ATPase
MAKSAKVPRELVMRYAGSTVKHLGSQMYSGLVESIAELIANAYDADAEHVNVTIPFDSLLNQDAVIEVSDDGGGMTFEDCNVCFLLIGRERRKNGNFTPNKHRKVMGRKGLGKLACFGISSLMEVATYKDGWTTRFEMDYEAIMKESSGAFVSETPYKPPILNDEATNLPNGTTIYLKRLHFQRQANEDDFRHSMARRFALSAPDFVVNINGIALKREDTPFEFRYPEAVGQVQFDDVPGLGTVQWWVGFTEKPIQRDDMKGISVIARGKLAQPPFFFYQTGGTHGQHGMQYMTGEVYADVLDDDAGVDLIATDRAGIRWSDSRANALLVWGQNKVKSLLADWADKRTQNRIAKLSTVRSQEWREIYRDRIQRYPQREREEIERAINQFAQIETLTDERFIELVDLFLKAFDNQHFMDMIRAINALDEMHQTDLLKLLTEANILEAVQMATLIRIKVEIIHKFKQLIDSEAREKPDMQNVLRDNPWLINPAWSTLQHEISLDRVIKKYASDLQPKSRGHKRGTADVTSAGNRRLDIFCLADSMLKVVVETKRPGLVVGAEEIQQTMGYVFFLRKELGKSNAPGSQVLVEGFLIASDIRQDDLSWKENAEKAGIYVRTWGDLWRQAEILYGDYLSLVKSKAPADDPRMQALEKM